MYKMHTNIVTQYLCDTFANFRKKNSQYYTRNEEKYIVPKCRLDIYKKKNQEDAYQFFSLFVKNTQMQGTSCLTSYLL